MIGVFDSGSGGLTVLKAIRERLPSADVLYFGDIKNAPYGERSRAELSRLTMAGLRLLQAQGATSIVSACNSVAASLAVSLFDTLELAPDRLIEMVGPTVRYLRGFEKRLLILATPATIASGIYQDAFAMAGVAADPLALPGLAGAIESGAPEETLEAILREKLAGLDREAYGGAVLACTHYPLAKGAFERAFPGLPLFDPAGAVAKRVEDAWWPREVGEGKTRLIVSKAGEPFRRFAALALAGRSFTLEVLE
jgi:glutamate racemase